MIRPVRVLIADDHRCYTAMLNEYFSLFPEIKVIGIAENGLQVFHKIEQQKPDVLLLDILMPGMDGLQLLKKLNALGKPKPAIFVVSGYITDEIINEVLSLGARYFISKPFDLNKMVSLITSADNNTEDCCIAYK